MSRLVAWLRDLIRRYVFGADIDEDMEQVHEVLAEGKEREAEAYQIIADVTGSIKVRRKASVARRQAREFRKRRADDAGVDVWSGGG